MTGVDEDVAAAADSVRRWVDVATWTAIGLGLAFTAVNVQQFAAAGAATWSPSWVVAWLLDPMVSVLLLAVVRAEQVTSRWQVAMPWQVVAVKWAAFAATYAMNTWSAWRDGVPSSVVLHSVPPVFVLLAAEAAPALRERLTEAVQVAAAAQRTERAIAPVDAVVPEVTTSQAPSEPATPTDRAAGETPEADPGPDSGVPAAVEPSDETSTDPRVQVVAELLAAGCDVTGPQVAAINNVSDRTGRRLLADARTHLEQNPARPDLHLVETRASGGTA